MTNHIKLIQHNTIRKFIFDKILYKLHWGQNGVYSKL